MTKHRNYTLGKNARRFASVFETCLETADTSVGQEPCRNKETGKVGFWFCVRADNEDGFLGAIAYEDGIDLPSTTMFMPYKGDSTPETLGALFGTLVATDSTFKPPTCPCCSNRGGKATTSH